MSGDSPASCSPCAGLTQTLRPYQADLADHVLDFVRQGVESLEVESDPRARRRIWSAPTGTGKGTVELHVQRVLTELDYDTWILTPSLEVVRGFLERVGVDPDGMGMEALQRAGLDHRISTPTKYRNMLVEGRVQTPDVILYDEVHHAIDDTVVGGLLLAACADTVFCGFTATPYRGTPAGTAALREAWGEPYMLMTFPEAVAEGACALPTFEVVPLVDDDVVRVVNGEFQLKALTAATLPRLKALAELVRGRMDADRGPVPTCVVLPGRDLALGLVEELDALGIAGDFVGQDTPAKERAACYARCRDGKSVLVTIQVLREGVDLPWLRRLVDAAPNVSPVAWAQKLGRITRPGEAREYICTNRNLERHAYLLGGAVPRSAVTQAQAAFGGASTRAGARAVGLESLKKFKAIPLPLADGGTAHMYSVYSVNKTTGHKVEYCTVVPPAHDEVYTVTRTVLPPASGDPSKRTKAEWGTWVPCDGLPVDLEGFATSRGTGKLSAAQARAWVGLAARFGLSTNVEKIQQRHYDGLMALAALKTVRL